MFEPDDVTNRDDTAPDEVPCDGMPAGDVHRDGIADAPDAAVDVDPDGVVAPGSCTLGDARAVPVVAGLLDAIDACRTVVASSLEGSTQRALVVGLTAAAASLELTRLQAVGALDTSGAWEADGSATAAGWIGRWTPGDRPAAARDVRTAKHLGHVPLVVQALAAGRITAAAARMIADAAAIDPDEFAPYEAPMINVAANGELRFLRNVLREWEHAVKPPKEGQEGSYDEFVRKRNLHLSTSLDGVVYLKGRLDPVTGAELVALVTARMDKLRRDDLDAAAYAQRTAAEQGLTYVAEQPRTPAQYRIDALTDLLHAGADTMARRDAPDELRTPALATAVTLIVRASDLRLPPEPNPLATPDELDQQAADASHPARHARLTEILGRDPRLRPPITITRADLLAILGLPADTPTPLGTSATPLIPVTLGDYDVLLPSGEVATLVCDCVLRRVTVGTNSEPLDVGREHRVATDAMRAALTVRDRGCVFPGCRRPPRWCHAHHIAEWERDHGHTAINNLALLCRRHHRLLHGRNGWRIRIAPDGHPTISHNGHDQPRNPHAPRLHDLTRGRPPNTSPSAA